MTYRIYNNKNRENKRSQEYKNQSNLKPKHTLLINITTLKLDNIRSVFVSLRFTWMYTLKYYNINAPFYVNLKTKIIKTVIMIIV